MGPKINTEEIDAMVQRAVAAAVQAASMQLAEDITQRFDAKYETAMEECRILAAQNDALKQSITGLEMNIEQMQNKFAAQEKSIADQLNMIQDLKRQINTCTNWSNNNEQYSRRCNLKKIIGLVRNEFEDTRLSVCNFLKEKLGKIIESNEIVTAHVLPTSPEFLQEKPPNIIVQFARRERHSEVIQRRRQLKNTGITILEHLTTSNVKLMNRVRNHPRIKNTWSSNGKIFGLTHNNNKVRFDLHDDINKKIDELLA